MVGGGLKISRRPLRPGWGRLPGRLVHHHHLQSSFRVFIFFFSSHISSRDVQALPREVKEDYTERAILAMNAMRAILAEYGLLE